MSGSGGTPAGPKDILVTPAALTTYASGIDSLNRNLAGILTDPNIGLNPRPDFGLKHVPGYDPLVNFVADYQTLMQQVLGPTGSMLGDLTTGLGTTATVATDISANYDQGGKAEAMSAVGVKSLVQAAVTPTSLPPAGLPGSLPSSPSSTTTPTGG